MSARPRVASGPYRMDGIAFLEEHLEWMRRCGRAPSTLRQRLLALTSLAEFLGRDPITATGREIEEWQDTAPSLVTMRHRTVLVRPYFRYLQARGYRVDDPCALVPIPRLPHRLPRPISEGDLARLLAAAPARVVPWLLLAGWSGLRAGEIAGLRVENFSTAADGTVWVRVIGKGDKQRDVPVPGWAWAQIRQALPDTGRCWRPVHRTLAGPVTAKHVTEAFRYLGRQVGLPPRITLHSLRHRAATELLRVSGGDLRLVQDFLGHANLSTLHIYTLVRSDRVSAAAALLPLPVGAGCERVAG